MNSMVRKIPALKRAGFTDKEVAREFAVSERTIRRYKRRLREEKGIKMPRASRKIKL
jgi:transposase